MAQIYAEAESNANLFAIAEAQQYKWRSAAKYTQKPRAMQTFAIAEAQQYKIFRRKNSFKILKIKIIIVYLQPAKVYCGI